MFQSATFKLTTWYLAILIAISLLFSVIIYAIASTEIGTRIGYLQRDSRIFRVHQTQLEDFRDIQVHKAEANLITSLIITNLGIWIIGGVGSYYLAKRSLKPIEEAHEAQSRFVSDASHELRTPLASMKTEIEVALQGPPLSKQELQDVLTSNLEEVNKLTDLSRVLLQLSRLDHENIPKEKIALTTLIQAVTKRFEKTSARIQLTNSKKHTIIANPSSIEELLTILLDNALKYSPERSPVSITIISEKHMAGFAIVNQGEGIPPAVLPHIFDRFYRADTSRTGGTKTGHGLGLALAKKIVELNNGDLTVSSAPGQETTFRVLLPTRHSKSHSS